MSLRLHFSRFKLSDHIYGVVVSFHRNIGKGVEGKKEGNDVREQRKNCNTIV